MGEWSEYFEDFPEENPVNQKQGPDLGPKSLAFPHLHLSQLTKAELEIENSKLQKLEAEEERKERERAEYIREIKSKPAYKVEICPICYNNKMNIYKTSNNSFYCECGECNVSGEGADVIDIFADIEYRIWTGES
ncbi:hypothetical protein [Acinetobacter chinensis]|uniref:hypothetical protein n=1 Tax=Acinetobacter chinensis TaxID=2004650 RepID=UPI002934100F|nr:hypothetical protein [Acinetobacter chinensis]WOE40718.1 hypothetical protein QSG87_12595 [Acinetobacter chinensis]